MHKRTVAIIGSFRQHWGLIQTTNHYFRQHGVQVRSPVGESVLKEGIEFVRFDTDNPNHSDVEIQSLTLHRIFSADVVYVVAPDGYIGRTTCYEIGRIIHAKIPLYFSESPKDLPIVVPAEFVVTVEALELKLKNDSWSPSWLYASGMDEVSRLERKLIEGNYQE